MIRKLIAAPMTVLISRILAVGVLVAAASAGVSQETLQDRIRDRLSTVGEVCVAGESCAEGLAVAGAASGPLEPEEVYQTFCMACHDTGASDAPIMGELADWEPRLERGMDSIYENAINGLNAMPPRGLCTNCSDDEVRATVDYMVAPVL